MWTSFPLLSARIGMPTSFERIDRDNEAWQDFGTTKYTAADGSNASSRESFQQPPSMGRGANGARTDSVWDIEVRIRFSRNLGTIPLS